MEGETLKFILEINHHPLPNYRLFKKETVALSTLLLSSGAAPPPGFSISLLKPAWYGPAPPRGGGGGVCPSSRESKRGLGQSHQPSQLWCMHVHGRGEKGRGRYTALPCALVNEHEMPQALPLGWLLAWAKAIPGPSLSSLGSMGLGHALKVALLSGQELVD